MKLLLDEDLNPKIAARLRTLGIDAVSVHEIGRQGRSDREQLEHAAATGRCLVTRNRNDFILLTRQFFEKGKPHCGVLIVPWTLPPDNFTRTAAAIRRYVKQYGDAPTEFLFDYVTGPAE